jgi:hypothetical protein
MLGLVNPSITPPSAQLPSMSGLSDADVLNRPAIAHPMVSYYDATDGGDPRQHTSPPSAPVIHRWSPGPRP